MLCVSEHDRELLLRDLEENYDFYLFETTGRLWFQGRSAVTLIVKWLLRGEELDRPADLKRRLRGYLTF